jgi:hypothetical protein
MHQVPDEYLAEMMPSAKKMMKAIGCSEYNVLQVSKRMITLHDSLFPL